MCITKPPHATTLSYYRAPVLVASIYDRWFRLNVIHDVDACVVKVYIDRVLKDEAPGSGAPLITSCARCMRRMMTLLTWSVVERESKLAVPLILHRS